MNFKAEFKENNMAFNTGFKETSVMQGKDGASAYEIAMQNGFEGSESEWLESLQGKDGADGQPGKDGTDGKDGVSPTVSVADIDGGHRVIITDAGGTETFDVMDGKADTSGSGGASVRADWNQNDETAADYVKNRTHYEIPTAREIEWDGDMTNRVVIDCEPLGLTGCYLVKVSDKIYTQEELIKRQAVISTGETVDIFQDSFVNPAPGTFVHNLYGFGVVYDAEALAAAMGAPGGYLQNGTFFLIAPEQNIYTAAIDKKYEIVRLNDKYLPNNAVRYIELDLGKPKCVLDAGWSPASSIQLSENETVEYLASNMIRSEVAVGVGDTVYIFNGVFQLSDSLPMIGTFYNAGTSALGDVQVFIKIDTYDKVVFVAAKKIVV